MNSASVVRRLGALVMLIAVMSGILSPRSMPLRAEGSDQASLEAAAVQDLDITVMPLIPCSGGRAATLDAVTVQNQQARLDSLYQQTYAPTEPTHVQLLQHQQALVSRFGPSGDMTKQGMTLCEPSGGVDHVKVLALTSTGSTAQITFEAHIWNETMGVANGVAFHYRPQSVVLVKTGLIKISGQWLVATRGYETFISGAP